MEQTAGDFQGGQQLESGQTEEVDACTVKVSVP